MSEQLLHYVRLLAKGLSTRVLLFQVFLPSLPAVLAWRSLYPYASPHSHTHTYEFLTSGASELTPAAQSTSRMAPDGDVQ